MNLLKTTLFVGLFVAHLVLGYDESEEDFAFDASEDLEVEFEEDNKQIVGSNEDLQANVGRVFHLVLATRGKFAGKTFDVFEVSVLMKMLLIILLNDNINNKIQDLKRKEKYHFFFTFICFKQCHL